MRIYICLLLICALLACKSGPGSHSKLEGANSKFLSTSYKLDTVATGLETCFGMDWLPDGRAIITERGKKTNGLSILNLTTGKLQAICNLPKVHRKGQGGMLDVLVHPDYITNGWIYLSFSAPRPSDKNTMVIERAKLDATNCLTQREQLFEAKPWHDESFHYGNRMAIKDGYLYLTMGERYFEKDSAQSLSNHLGKIMRLHDDGRIPTDNPFAAQTAALREIYSYGHRNPQGLDFRPGTDQVWASEHGPQGGDEVNWIRPGLNYGWPVITYGENYGGGKIGDGIKEKPGMEQPIHYYVPSIAPGGMAFYHGDKFPEWQGNLFIGALAKKHLNRLVLDGDKVMKEERLFEGMDMSIRLVKTGPDGYLYFSTNDGLLLRIVPVM